MPKRYNSLALLVLVVVTMGSVMVEGTRLGMLGRLFENA